jgi:hypothetical protein
MRGVMPRRRAKAKPVPWWRPTLTTGKPDWREYLLWQFGLLFTALSLLYVILLSRGLPVADPVVLDRAILTSLLVDLAACGILWHLINAGWSRSKRFALAFLILADIFAKFLFLRLANPGDGPLGSGWFELIVALTGLYLAGTGVIGLVVWLRGDDVRPWWKSGS